MRTPAPSFTFLLIGIPIARYSDFHAERKRRNCSRQLFAVQPLSQFRRELQFRIADPAPPRGSVSGLDDACRDLSPGISGRGAVRHDLLSTNFCSSATGAPRAAI